MNRWIDRYCRLLEFVMASALALMVVLVFGNVVLRYAFNSGIAVSEEVSRWLFVWMTFIGAVVAVRENAHLGTDALVSRLGVGGRRCCMAVGLLTMLAINVLLFQGSWMQASINLGVQAPVTGTPVAVFYASGVFFAAASGLLLLVQLLRVLSGRMGASELVMVQESEDHANAASDTPAPVRAAALRT